MITTRRARTSDYDALASIWQQADELHLKLRPDFFQPSTTAIRTARHLREVIEHPFSVLLVAEQEDGVVGLVHVKIYDAPDHPQVRRCRRGFVEELVVDAAHHRRGVGRALMQAATDWAKARDALQLVLNVWAGNEAAERFYLALGYAPVSKILGLELAVDERTTRPPNP